MRASIPTAATNDRAEAGAGCNEASETVRFFPEITKNIFDKANANKYYQGLEIPELLAVPRNLLR
jgi:hypothetical protein